MVLFFIRHFNDVDHTTPIVWKMVTCGYPCAVFCLNPRYDLESDYRLNFLSRMGVPVKSIYDSDDFVIASTDGLSAVGCQMVARLFSACFAVENKLLSVESLKWLSPVAGKLGDKLYSAALGLYFNRQWAVRFIESMGAKALCFDWVKPGHSVVGKLLKAAKVQAVPTISMPHGVFVYTNADISIKSRPLQTFNKLDRYDAVIVQNKRFREFMIESGLAPDKIHVLGSARYSADWVAQNQQLLPRKISQAQQPGGRLKVTLMTTKLRYRVDAERMIRAIRLLAGLNGIELVIKPHTRSGSEVDIYKGAEAHLAEDISSVELCQWADVVLVIASSIMLEALIQGKPVLYLKYLHENTTIYENCGACWTIDSEAAMLAALESLRDGEADIPYTPAGAQEFIADVVYEGKMDTDVLQNYVDFITGSAAV